MKAKEIWFCKGRVNFLKNRKKPKNSYTFPLVIAIFNRSYNSTPVIRSFYHKENDLMNKNQKIEDFL